MNLFDLFMTLCLCIMVILFICTEVDYRRNKKKKKSYYDF